MPHHFSGKSFQAEVRGLTVTFSFVLFCFVCFLFVFLCGHDGLLDIQLKFLLEWENSALRFRIEKEWKKIILWLLHIMRNWFNKYLLHACSEPGLVWVVGNTAVSKQGRPCLDGAYKREAERETRPLRDCSVQSYHSLYCGVLQRYITVCKHLQRAGGHCVPALRS